MTELMAVTNGFDRSRALPGGFAFGDTVAVIGLGEVHQPQRPDPDHRDRVAERESAGERT